MNPFQSSTPLLARLAPAFAPAWQPGVRSPHKIMLQLNAQAWQCAENGPRTSSFSPPDLLCQAVLAHERH
ncbi:hypothetical protein TU78_14895 [Pseudomonas taetrolens]|uniref:Uncharacterized protein n=1 Tax=Pseudomonas taetrolens TaxID=47884 RepID=A0A0J6GQ80_PSETA|nr:hypothetical protein [Pseudomonas taetrolens]KMM83765.1 hypothetical protein TU78_14895 [Pseudomonas taetrolens]